LLGQQHAIQAKHLNLRDSVSAIAQALNGSSLRKQGPITTDVFGEAPQRPQTFCLNTGGTAYGSLLSQRRLVETSRKTGKIPSGPHRKIHTRIPPCEYGTRRLIALGWQQCDPHSFSIQAAGPSIAKPAIANPTLL
jgi:hypothetical protein